VRTRMPWRWVGVVVISVVPLTGCRGTLPDGRGWGHDALRVPSWEQVGHAAVDAVLTPETLGPAAGAIIFYSAGHIDRELADWAADHTPLFGSRTRAAKASDYLEGAAVLAWVGTALAIPSEKPLSGPWWAAKGEEILTEGLAVGATSGVTTLLKDVVIHRRRPDGSDQHSFPSGHTATAAVGDMLAARNLESLPLAPGERTAGRLGLFTLTMGTAWARIEAHKHFPSDVLAGAALGNFLGAFVNEAFLGLHRPQDTGVMIQPSRTGVMLGVHWPLP
jgi:membrane-associated phospholipid phosphatase